MFFIASAISFGVLKSPFSLVHEFMTNVCHFPFLPASLQGVVSHLRDPLPPQEMVPTLQDLCLLPVSNWYLLGLQLGISADELDVIERNYPRDNHMCKAKMFAAWLRVDTRTSYRKLARALVAVGIRNIAEAVCTARGMEVTTLECLSS